MKYVSIAAFFALALASAPSFAGDGCGHGHGGGNPKNNANNVEIVQKPLFVWQDGKFVLNPKRI